MCFCMGRVCSEYRLSYRTDRIQTVAPRGAGCVPGLRYAVRSDSDRIACPRGLYGPVCGPRVLTCGTIVTRVCAARAGGGGVLWIFASGEIIFSTPIRDCDRRQADTGAECRRGCTRHESRPLGDARSVPHAPQAPRGSNFCIDRPFKMSKIVGKEDGSVEKTSDQRKIQQLHAF